MCKVLLSTFLAVMFLFAGAIAAQDASKQEHPSSGASPSKVAQVLGTAAKYKVSEADRNAGWC